jgi:hypothetical protein
MSCLCCQQPERIDGLPCCRRRSGLRQSPSVSVSLLSLLSLLIDLDLDLLPSSFSLLPSVRSRRPPNGAPKPSQTIGVGVSVIEIHVYLISTTCLAAASLPTVPARWR